MARAVNDKVSVSVKEQADRKDAVNPSLEQADRKGTVNTSM
ncbi:hypothetical protein [Yersinia enterocolitica]|nr:hypothetical protein [Yersinia enterocolitica]